MKSSFDWKEYQRLELIPSEKPTLKQRVQQLWHDFIADLKGSAEPRLWQTIDRNGQSWWDGYDPTTGRSVSHLSESDLLRWLEQRHYSHSEFDQPKRPNRHTPYEVLR